MKLFYCFPSKLFLEDGCRFVFQERREESPDRGGNRGNPEQGLSAGQETRVARANLDRMGLSFLAGDLNIRTSGNDDLNVLRQEVEREIQAGDEVIRLFKREMGGRLVLPTDQGIIQLADLSPTEGWHRESIARHYGLSADSKWSEILQHRRGPRMARRGR